MVTVGELQYKMTISGEGDVRGAMQGASQDMAAAGEQAGQAGEQVHGLGDELVGTGEQATATSGQMAMFGEEMLAAGADAGSLGEGLAGAGEGMGQLGDDATGLHGDMAGAGEAMAGAGAEATVMAGDVQSAAGDVSGLGDEAISAAGDVSGFGDQMEQTGQDTASAGSLMMDSLKDVGAVVVGAFATNAVVDFAGSMLQTSAQVRTSGQLMEFAFADQTDAVRDWSDEWRSQLGLTEAEMDNMTSSTAFMLQGLGIATDEAARLTPEFNELAIAIANVDPQMRGVEEASHAVNSAITGQRQQLESYGVVIRQADIDQRMVAEGMDHLTGEARELAEVQALLAEITDRTTGAQQQLAENGIDPAMKAANEMNGAFAELREEIAQGLEPVMMGFARGTSALLGDEMSRNALLAGGLGLAIQHRLLPRMKAANTAAGGFRGSLRSMGRAMAPGAALAVGIGTITALWDQHNQRQQEAEARQAGLRDAFLETNGAIEGQAEALFLNEIQGLGLEEQLNQLGIGLGDLADVVMGSDEAWERFLADIWETGSAAGMSGGDLLMFQHGLETLRDRMQSAHSDFEETNELLGETGDKATDAADAAGNIAGEFHEMETAADQARSELDELVNSLSEITDQHFSLQNAQIDQIESMDALSASVEENGLTLDENTEAGRSNITALQDLIGTHEGMVQALLDHGATEEEAQLIMAGSRQAAEDHMIALGFTEDQIRDYIAAMDDIDEQVETEILPAIGTWQGLIGQARDYAAAIRGIPSSASTTISVGLSGIGASIATGGASLGGDWRGGTRHTGGLVPGHAGDEVPMMLLGREEVITESDPRHQSNMGRAGMGGGGGVGPIVIELHTSGRMEKAMFEGLRYEVRRQGGGGPNSVQVALGT